MRRANTAVSFHIFLYPFYYIDYTLAQVCALQFWNKSEKIVRSMEEYLPCRLGGTKPFTELIKATSLKIPFEWNY